ncbi:hypothetical protein ACFQJ5_01700 [Halomicroarcula sp. GCM10025324]|uniref:hypothetical protein n=1 Tax=Haloarcula TaxID=2237 RepID=UPI0023E7FE7A|nr:hypothetical protein [Halomicroarcula sp. ZS-22-S1]
MTCLQTRLLGVQLLALAIAIVGEVAGSRVVTTLGVAIFFVVLAMSLVTWASERASGVLERIRGPSSRRTDR